MKRWKTMITMVVMMVLVSIGILGCAQDADQGTGAPDPANEQPASGGEDSSSETEKADIDYPTKPIQVIVPAGAGGDTDLNVRTLGKYLQEELGQPVVISNVSGAGGTTGSRQVLDAAPDGYTVLFFHNSLLLNKILGLVDFTFSDFEVAGIGILDHGNSFIVNSQSQFEDANDLVAYARENPGAVSIATEVGGFTHLQLLALEKATDTTFNIVDVGGAADKVAALLGGHIDIVPTQYGLVKSYIDSGDFRSLGIFAEEQVSLMPDVPTFIEQGIDVSFEKFFFFAFPPGTPEEIVEVFTQALEKVVTTNDEYRAEVEQFLVSPTYMNPQEAFEYMKRTEEYYTELHGTN